MKWPIVLLTILAGVLIPLTSARAQNLTSESVAYRELLQQKSDIELKVQHLNELVTATHPQMVLEKERLRAIEEEISLFNEAGLRVEKLDDAAGKLLIRRAFLKADLRTLRRDFTANHPLIIAKRHELDFLTDEVNDLWRTLKIDRTP